MRFTNPHPKICARNEIQFTTSIYNTMQHKVLNFIISSFIFYKNVINIFNINLCPIFYKVLQMRKDHKEMK